MAIPAACLPTDMVMNTSLTFGEISQPTATIVGASIAAVVVVFGWVVTHTLAAARDSANRRQEAHRLHLEAQLSELYGPLYGLVRQITLIFEVACATLPTEVRGAERRIKVEQFLADKQSIEYRRWRFYVDRFFLPLNREITSLLRTKMHLLQSPADAVLPPSLSQFLRHSAGFEAIDGLSTEKDIRTAAPEVLHLEWPPTLERDVEVALLEIKSAYLNCVGGRRRGSGNWLFRGGRGAQPPK